MPVGRRPEKGVRRGITFVPASGVRVRQDARPKPTIPEEIRPALAVADADLPNSELALRAMPAIPPAIEEETQRVRRVQDKQAPRYDRQISFFERILFSDGRAWVCSQARGRVLELACGTARNLPFYPSDVQVTAIELSPQMLAIARKRAQELGHPADLRLGDVQRLDFPDESFDTVTCTLGFCTIPDTTTAAREAFRVLRPSGQLLMLEHVRSPVAVVRGGQRLLEPVAERFEADHLLREPLDYLPGVGFAIDEVQRMKWGIVERLRAHKPGKGTE
jgi:ubiquinone/menaquinone biosynthesis C-methylase UbiE